jgi:hypothetical protein
VMFAVANSVPAAVKRSAMKIKIMRLANIDPPKLSIIGVSDVIIHNLLDPIVGTAAARLCHDETRRSFP